MEQKLMRKLVWSAALVSSSWYVKLLRIWCMIYFMMFPLWKLLEALILCDLTSACPSNCKMCTVNADDTTKCTACYDYKGQGKQGFFLKKSDSTCAACPSNCESCIDNGQGVGICKSCFKAYVPLDDEKDDTKDGTVCLSMYQNICVW